MASNDSNPTVTPEQPQTDAALKIKDPTSVDDVFTYHYDQTAAAFTISSTYNTYLQDAITPDTPKQFNGKYAPTASAFILEVNGAGFDVFTSAVEPLKIYAIINNFIAVIPPLPSSTNLKGGTAFGYVVKSPTKLWVYFSRLTFQKIWFSYDPKTFTGKEDPNKQQIESARIKYSLANNDNPTLTIQIAINSGLSQQVNYFSSDVNNFKSLNVTLSQSPYITTLQGRFLNGSTYPNVLPNGNDQPLQIIYLYGHNLQDQQVMMIKQSSKILNNYPSALPQEILDANQDAATIAGMNAQALASLEYFKVGNFLGELTKYTTDKKLTDYTYRSPDGTLLTSGKTGVLPSDVEAVQFQVKTLPAGTYYVVVYDSVTGDYDVAPVLITISLAAGNLQVHDVTPSTVVLQSPSFTVNGFNFPTSDDINNGATMTVSLVDSNTKNSVPGQGLSSLFENAILVINKTSPTTSIFNNGSITLTSNSQFVAKFTDLHVTTADLVALADNTFKLYVEITYASPNPSQGKINEAVLSGVLQIQEQPVIYFLTNTESDPPENIYPKSLVRVDQATGQVIAFGTPQNYLYVVGRNFNTGGAISVLINGVQQQVLEPVVWPDSFYNAIKVKVDPSNIKGDATVEVRVGSASSEAYQLSITFRPTNVVTDAKGKHTSAVETLSAFDFRNVLPYNQLDQVTLLNSNNTKVASSVALTLINKQTKQSVQLKADLNSSVALPFLPDEVTIPANTPLSASGALDVTFYFYNLYNINISTPKIYTLQHEDGDLEGTFKPKEKMTVVGTGFVNGMRYNINKTGWNVAPPLSTTTINNTKFQTFTIIVPASSSKDATIQVSNDQAAQVDSIITAGRGGGNYKNSTNVVNDRYSPLLKINQRLPAGIKMYAKGPQVAMTDKIDANMSIYGQITPFLGSFKTLLIVIRIIVCIIDVICALINPFQLIVAIIALMDCIIDLLSLFPQLAVPIMILSFLQNFIGFLQTFITQIEAYVFSIVNSQLALVEAQISQDIALLAAAEQQAFGATKQIRDAISFLEPALQVIQIFKDLLAFAMHFPCAGNQGGNQDDGTCPPGNMQKLIKEIVQDKTVAPNTYTIDIGNMTRTKGVVTAKTSIPNKLTIGTQFTITPGERAFPTGTKTIVSIVDSFTFTYNEDGYDAASTVVETLDTIVTSDQQATLATMFCQAVALQTSTLQTMPGFNGLDSFGNPLPGGPLAPGSTSVVPTITPVLPNVSAAIECMNNYTDQIEAALNAGQVFVTTAEQGQQLVNAYTQCVQNLLDQTNQALSDTCVLAVSALNSELKVSPKGRIGPDLTDDFVRTKLALPSTQPNNAQNAGLTLDLAQLDNPNAIPTAINTDPNTGAIGSAQNFGTQQDIYTPVIFQSTNKSGQRQNVDTIYFNADNPDVGGLITVGDILEIVGGPFSGLQFPILGIQQIFSAVRLTCKLDITFEQKLLVGEQPLPLNLSNFDVRIIAHLAGNDAVAVVPADDSSVATLQILARDHHGHEIGNGLANKIALNIESGTAEFVPIIPSATTDVTGVIQESGTHYIANLKANCAGTVILSASVCGVEFVDIGYHANDPNHTITTRKKTVKIIFTPPIPKTTPSAFGTLEKGQVPGTHFVN